MTPAEELRAAVRLLRHPFNCLPSELLTTLADLLEVIGEFSDQYVVNEHVDGEPCDDFACRIVVAARKVARAQPGIEEEAAKRGTR